MTITQPADLTSRQAVHSCDDLQFASFLRILQYGLIVLQPVNHAPYAFLNRPLDQVAFAGSLHGENGRNDRRNHRTDAARKARILRDHVGHLWQRLGDLPLGIVDCLEAVDEQFV